MDKVALITLGQGSLQEGYPFVRVQLLAGPKLSMSCDGSLPSAPHLVEAYRQWRLLYEALYQQLNWSTRIEITPGDILQVSDQNLDELCQSLYEQFNAWLDAVSFAPIDRALRRELSPRDEIQVVLETRDHQVQRLPWHLWSFLQDYPQAEVVMSLPRWQQKSTVRTDSTQVRILAIFGNSQGLDLGPDRQLLDQIPKSQVAFLQEPSREILDQSLWNPQGWDILCFSGHSKTEDGLGCLYLNGRETLTLDQLRNSLQAAIRNGLQIAIFNSCDGIGLASQLADLQIPQVIVMQEPVVDQVAHQFLKNFITALAQGHSLHGAVRRAREQLQGLEANYPCASWLPLLFKNPAVPPLRWQDLHQRSSPLVSRSNPSPALRVAGLVTGLVLVLRSMGLWQGLELQGFDYLLRRRPPEPTDDRILVVLVEEADLQWQRQEGWQPPGSLADQALARLMHRIQPYSPRIIALDIYHDFPFSPELIDLLETSQIPFIAPCQGASATSEDIAGPPDWPPTQLGFTDWPQDPDNIVRRQLLGMADSDACPTSYSLSLRVAGDFLAHGAGPGAVTAPDFSQGSLRIGDVEFKKLPHNAGGYQLPIEEALGYQLLVNYRSVGPDQISLRELVEERSETEVRALVEDRIVLIGTGTASNDVHLTPFSGRRWPEEIPGVIVHSQMISQILSTVIDQRPLIWWWPEWAEALWIGGWALVGSGLVRSLSSPLGLAIATSLTAFFCVLSAMEFS
jgi:CHASE2 domain-containing sensor protein